MSLPFDPGAMSWGHGGGAAPSYPLKVGALAIGVVVGGASQMWRPLAPEAERNRAGAVRSAITSQRGHRDDHEIQTIPMSRAAAETLVGALTAGGALTFSGYAVDGSVVGFARKVGTTTDPESGRVQVAFEIHVA